MNHLVLKNDWLTLYHGNAHDYDAPEIPDLILTNPYGPLPPRLRGVPMLVHQWVHRQRELEAWVGVHELEMVSLWSRGREAVWAVNQPAQAIDLTDLVPTAEGWWPEGLPRRLLEFYGHVGETLWDGFLGRGTGAKAAHERGMKVIGIDERVEAIDAALAYLGLPPANTGGGPL